MKSKKKLVLLSLVAVPSLLYTAPVSAAELPNSAYITANYNANVANVVQLINNINNTTATFQTNLEAALKAYNALTGTEKQYVTNYSTLSAHQQTRIAYRKLAAQIEEKLYSVDSTSPNYYQNVTDTKDWYNTLNAAQKTFVSASAQKILTSYIAPNTSVDKVVNKIQLINSSRLSFHKDVANARAELNALRRFSNISLPAGIEQQLLDAEQLVVKDKAAAKEVENAIAALSPKTSTAQDVQAVKTSFEALTPVQQQLVPNVWTLVDFVQGKHTLPTKDNIPKKPDLSDTAAIPGKTTAMTKNKNTYRAKINVAASEIDTERYILTTKDKMTIIIPPLYTLVNEDEGIMDIQVTKKANRITLQATLNKKPVTFDANMEIIIEGLTANSSIVRSNDLGKRVPADFIISGNRHIIQTTISDTFQILNN
ncbi:hypothetical protein M5J14_20460 [Lysinibacillus sp. OL1_EC]|uniref:hypothetical protein n=1 Tax=unclassified Lysinibacillus TaxID=2636778 RepID=UPI00103ED345|nr:MULTISPECIES: hypothetical protein [unclassified Lysinibacillus]MCM0626875.1 hypothetical protein [Lysinibacillus sp. OL1_EC]MCS5503746.1 hypothetical protein [Lysinibacillus sp. A4]TBV85592.1 hypothetical protein EW028_20715 [Lysinibacillus sp. OL1]UKJ45670.1 hypothetical protein L6W14_01100 [Lysinibacillus sp. ACHW1.5]WGT40519.1 hypothetical protein QH639_07045 [Lysinibacillus sp. 1 U-2021]